ncbi:MAG: glycosyl hydrolase family 18 protein [Janthinobacterium lividum]
MLNSLFRMLFSVVFSLSPAALLAQGSLPIFTHTIGDVAYTVIGNDPAKGGTANIPVTIIPVSLTFESSKGVVLSPALDIAKITRSPVFASYKFETSSTQYADALLRASFYKAAQSANTLSNWHTILAKPTVAPVLQVQIPAGYGYTLSDKRAVRTMAVVDIEWLQKKIFEAVPPGTISPDRLVMFVTHNTTYYAEGDATVCCSWGTNGTDRVTKQPFILASYLDLSTVAVDKDIQPLTEQLAEFVMNPGHDPLAKGHDAKLPGNTFGTGWMRPVSAPASDFRCAGTGSGSQYFMLLPTDINAKNNFPASPAFVAGTYHLQNAPVFPWYTGTTATESWQGKLSFPDSTALTVPMKPCTARGDNDFGRSGTPPPRTPPAAFHGTHGHQLIGYWNGGGKGVNRFRLRDVSPQWDVIIVAFAVPVKSGEAGMVFRTPFQYRPEEFKAEIDELHGRGKKVIISLGGGGQNFQIRTPEARQQFIDSVTRIVEQYGFDGIDIDFEAPSIVTEPGDLDFRHPTSAGTVNLIAALHTLHNHLGSNFMISLVPEGTQTPGGYPSYGGQFGSYLPLIYGLRDILTFSDTQDYNTPPLQGLDGNIYQAGTVDYHAAMTELMLRGFPVGRNSSYMFPPVPANKIAVGFLNSDTKPQVVVDAMNYIITGKAPLGTKYKLLKPTGYPEMRGAMFWTIDADRRGEYNYSNTVGPQLHSFSEAK